MAAASPLSVDDLGSTPPAAASHAPQQHADLLAPLPRREPADRLPLTRSEVPQLFLPGPVVPPWIPDMAGRHRFGTFQPPPLRSSAASPRCPPVLPARLCAWWRQGLGTYVRILTRMLVVRDQPQSVPGRASPAPERRGSWWRGVRSVHHVCRQRNGHGEGSACVSACGFQRSDGCRQCRTQGDGS